MDRHLPVRDYDSLKGCDLKVKKDGWSLWLEVKLDWMSQTTGNVCIELEALAHSRASVLIYGLPQTDWTDIYKMPLKQMYEYAKSYPVKKHVGQYQLTSAIIPKHVFTSLPFVKRFSLEESLYPYKVLTA